MPLYKLSEPLHGSKPWLAHCIAIGLNSLHSRKGSEMNLLLATFVDGKKIKCGSDKLSFKLACRETLLKTENVM